MGRGLSEASQKIIEAAALILEREPTSVRGVCYALFVGTDIPTPARLITGMEKKNTNMVSALLVRARLDGTIPWEAIYDETRELDEPSSWNNPKAFFQSIAGQHSRNHWQAQPQHIQLWTEKSTVSGWLRPVIDRYQLPLMVTHGNQGWTWLYRVAEMSLDLDKPLLLFGVNDCDPSGCYMTEVDLPNRLAQIDHNIEIRRILLHPAQCRTLPPWDYSERDNKLNAWYRRHYGPNAWELDAMPPQSMRDTIEQAVREAIDLAAWERSLRAERTEQRWVVREAMALAAKWAARRR